MAISGPTAPAPGCEATTRAPALAELPPLPGPQVPQVPLPLPPMLLELPALPLPPGQEAPDLHQHAAAAHLDSRGTTDAGELPPGVQSEPATPTSSSAAAAALQLQCGVLAEMEEQKRRFRSVDAGMTALVEQATVTHGTRYVSVQESISKTLRQRGPSLFLTKQPIIKYPLYPGSLALAAASAAGVTGRGAPHLLMGAALEGSSLEAHLQLQAAAREQQLEDGYQQHCWKPARRSTVMRRVNAVALSLPAPWGNAAAGGAQQEAQAPGRPRRITPVWDRLSRTPTTSNSGAAASPPPSRGGARSLQPAPPAAGPGRKGSQQPLGPKRLPAGIKARTGSRTTPGAADGAAQQRGSRAAGSHPRLPSLPGLLAPRPKSPATTTTPVPAHVPAPPTPPQQQELSPSSRSVESALFKSTRGTELLAPLGAGASPQHHPHGPMSIAWVGGGGRVSRVTTHEAPPAAGGHMPTAGSAARISLLLHVYNNQGGGGGGGGGR
ncbi:hypothetical protein HYH02_002942 [Chlamydomonas schloesseri]|uniref:Uncharacterized protein n=1 Tax=Chlamydomonas schloesseri TaxID=2026947 RepID=A0A835WS74_9CHLO|nr:hypothetical protein HYH02_002942 [Chlamydomonas schloesseri]|eukprot:KAG2452710.1 hypothetical protein HYH02_002942 [Chlamydomonas schloesseri]